MIFQQKKRWAIYRIHYGLDFLKQSIDSIIDSVDQIFVIYSLRPWVVKPTVQYLGSKIPVPELNENVEEFMYKHYSNDSRVVFFNFEYFTPKNQFRLYYDICVSREGYYPRTVMFMEPDIVFLRSTVEPFISAFENQTDVALVTTNQIELWRNINYRIPERPYRAGATLWAPALLPEYQTGFSPYNSSDGKTHTLYCPQTFNFGFCLNETTMLYKHLLAINFASVIGDTVPNETWYRDKWLNWQPGIGDLEISQGFEHYIPEAVSYELPVELKQQLGIVKMFNVIVPVMIQSEGEYWNNFIARLRCSLQSLSRLPGINICIVDASLEKNSQLLEVLKDIPHRYLDLTGQYQNFHRSSILNRAVNHWDDTEWYIISDHDILYADDYVLKIKQHILSNNSDCLVPQFYRSLWEQLTSNYQDLINNNNLEFQGPSPGCLVFSKRAFNKLKGYNERYWIYGCEDSDFVERANRHPEINCCEFGENIYMLWHPKIYSEFQYKANRQLYFYFVEEHYNIDFKFVEDWTLLPTFDYDVYLTWLKSKL